MMGEYYVGDRGFVHGQGQGFRITEKMRPPPTVNQAGEWIIVEVTDSYIVAPNAEPRGREPPSRTLADLSSLWMLYPPVFTISQEHSRWLMSLFIPLPVSSSKRREGSDHSGLSGVGTMGQCGSAMG